MQDLLHNDVVQWIVDNLIAFLVGVGLIIAAIVGALIARSERKNRLWYWASVSPVVQEKLEDDEIEIKVGGRTQSEVYICLIDLLYKGKPIAEDDYDPEDPVIFKFRDTQVVAAKAFDPVRPEYRRANMHPIDGNTVVLEPLRLNDGSQIKARALLTHEKPPEVRGFITDVDIANGDQQEYRLGLISGCSFVLLVLLGIIGSFFAVGVVGMFSPEVRRVVYDPNAIVISVQLWMVILIGLLLLLMIGAALGGIAWAWRGRREIRRHTD